MGSGCCGRPGTAGRRGRRRSTAAGGRRRRGRSRSSPRRAGGGSSHGRGPSRRFLLRLGVSRSRYRGPMAVTRAIELRTEIPGPRSREIIERKERVVADPLGLYLPIVIADGSGAIVTDVDGNSFVDFAGGVGCLNVGHAHPRVVAAVQEQAA